MLKAIILASQSRAKYQNSPADFISTNLCSRGASGLLRVSACTNRQNRRSCRREVAIPTSLPQSISSHCPLSWATCHLSPRIQSNCAHLPPLHHEPQGRARGRGEFSIPHPPGRSGTGLPPPPASRLRPPPSPASAPRPLPSPRLSCLPPTPRLGPSLTEPPPALREVGGGLLTEGKGPLRLIVVVVVGGGGGGGYYAQASLLILYCVIMERFDSSSMNRVESLYCICCIIIEW